MKRRNYLITLFLIICIGASAVGLCACNTSTQECTHDGLAKVNAKNATCTEDGNIEYWHCSTCLKNFADANGNTELNNVTAPSAGHDLDVEYRYEEKVYHIVCNRCDYSEDVNAGSAAYPYLARNEEELHNLVDAAAANSVFKLANDIDVTYVNFNGVYTLPEGSTLDLGGYTVHVTKAPGCFVVEGVNVTLQNGTLDLTKGGDYSLFVGDESENNTVTVKNLTTNAGFNVYNCIATIIDCNVDASQRDYYALWADEHSTINVESGTYVGGETACVHSTASAEDEENNGNIILNGGTFVGDIFATRRTEIHGGVIDGTVKLTDYSNCPAYLLVDKDYNEPLNIVCGKTGYELVQTTDENGNRIYQQQAPSAD